LRLSYQLVFDDKAFVNAMFEIVNNQPDYSWK